MIYLSRVLFSTVIVFFILLTCETRRQRHFVTVVPLDVYICWPLYASLLTKKCLKVTEVHTSLRFNWD